MKTILICCTIFSFALASNITLVEKDTSNDLVLSDPSSDQSSLYPSLIFDEINDEEDIHRLYSEFKKTNKSVKKWLLNNFQISLYPKTITNRKSKREIFFASILLQIALDYNKMKNAGIDTDRKLDVPRCSTLFIQPKNARFLRNITGGQSKIYKQTLANNQAILIKKCHKQEDCEREFRILENLRVPNISSPICYDDNIIGYKFFKGGDLFVDSGTMKNIVNLDTESSFLGPFFKKIIAALHKIQQENILHLDIKPENIVIDGPDRNFFNLRKTDSRLQEYIPILIDFGASVPLDEMESVDFNVGTIIYKSPEQVWQNSVSFSTDWWQLGATLWACAIMVDTNVIYSQKVQYLQRKNTSNDRRYGAVAIRYPPSFDEALIDVLNMLLDPMEAQRDFSDPQAFELLINMPFFN